MKTLILAANRCSLMFTAVAALSIAYPASVQAVPTTYNYTGNPFTFASPPYSTSDFVTAMVTLASPLGPNMPLTMVTPLAFSLFDGVQTITNLNATSSTFQFATGPTGMILNWDIRVFGAPGFRIFTINTPDFIEDVASVATPGATPFNQNNPGTWTTVGAVSDTGSTLSLMTLTLMALGVVTWQFKRAAA